jgi:hypothetical protein
MEIVAYNRRDFPASATELWGIEAQGPSTFLRHLYDLDPAIVVDKLHSQARNLGRSLPEQLIVLRKAAGGFVRSLCEDLGIDLELGDRNRQRNLNPDPPQKPAQPLEPYIYTGTSIPSVPSVISSCWRK